jgi:hypothetical protein
VMVEHTNNLLTGDGKPPIRTELTLPGAIDKAFIAAFLLSGDAARAEAAVLKGIEWIDSDGGQGEDLLQSTVKAAIERDRFPGLSPKPSDSAVSRLPLELQRVLRLPHFLRHCFVLRVLAGLPPELCACLLNANGHQVDKGTCAAMRELPSIREKSFVTHCGWDGSNN